MIRLAWLFGLILTGTCTAADDKKDDKKEVPKELVPFQGAWKVVKAESGGKGPPGGLTEEVRFTFTGNKLTIKEGKATPHEGTYSVDPNKDPAEIDLINAKKEKSLGIYQFDKDGKLTVSFVRKPGAMRPKKFGEAETVQVVLEKVKEKADDKKEIAKEHVPFQGTWKVVKLEFGGKEPPGGLPENERFTFTGDKLLIKEGKEDLQEGTYSIDSKKEPAELDFITSKNEKILCIYKFEKDGKLVVNTSSGPGAMRPKKFGEAETVLFVLEKAKE
jgi:uncharacterized protein (TIGR03067 family)